METNVPNAPNIPNVPTVPSSPRTAMPLIAGILSIISGAGKLLGFLGLIVASIFMIMPERFSRINLTLFLVIGGIVLIVLGVLAIVGGVYSIQRKKFGLSLAGAIAALLPFNLLGLAAVILVALARREFPD
jgi:hypothetical protein